MGVFIVQGLKEAGLLLLRGELVCSPAKDGDAQSYNPYHY